jgi:hypothetical protein
LQSGRGRQGRCLKTRIFTGDFVTPTAADVSFVSKVAHRDLLRYRFPPDIIRHPVWLYECFTLGYRDVEDLLAERGLDISYETMRRWVLKFGVSIRPRIASSTPTADVAMASRRDGRNDCGPKGGDGSEAGNAISRRAVSSFCTSFAIVRCSRSRGVDRLSAGLAVGQKAEVIQFPRKQEEGQ